VTWVTKQFLVHRQQGHTVNDFAQKPTSPLYFIGAACLIIILYQRLHLPTLRLVLRLALWPSCVIDTHTCRSVWRGESPKWGIERQKMGQERKI